MSTSRRKRNLDLKKRYHFLRSLGYSSYDANKMKQRSFIDTSLIKLKKDKKGRTTIVKSKAIKNTSYIVDAEMLYLKSRPNNSVYTDWGNITHTRGLKDRAMKLAKLVAVRDKKDLDYGYWYIYQLYITDYSDQDFHALTQEQQSYDIYLKKKTSQSKSKNKSKSTKNRGATKVSVKNALSLLGG
jgi:hypothetical protein